MPIPSRWTEEVPNCSLQQWIFGSSSEPLPDRMAFIDADRPETHRVTFADYRLLSKRFAVGLKARGVKPGDRVLLFSGNSIFFPSVFIGVLMAGAVFTGANPGYVARELAYQIKDSGAVLVIAAAGSLDTALEAAKEAGIPPSSVYVFDTSLPDTTPLEQPATRGARHWTELLAAEPDARVFDWKEPADARTTTCCLNYSSGTTGVPKGVEITHYNYVANGTGVVKISKLSDDYADDVQRARGLCFLPMYHAYAQVSLLSGLITTEKYKLTIRQTRRTSLPTSPSRAYPHTSCLPLTSSICSPTFSGSASPT